MNISGIYPVWDFGGNNQQDKKHKPKGEGFGEVLKEEMEKRNESEVLPMRQGDNRR